MKNKSNKISSLKEDIFMLIANINNKISKQMNEDEIDAQSIYALVKLVDSFLKLYNAELLCLSKDMEIIKEELKEDDKSFLKKYEEKMAPRAGFEPATKRLTAACSTTELPRNNNV
jgi:hypothetical protein